MFDIGFTELIIIGVVGLLVIGPERLPSAIRTGNMWLRKIRRGFSDIKREVEQELHNDSVLQELRQTGSDLKNEVDNISGDLKNVTASVSEPAVGTDVSSRAQRQDNSGND